MLFVMTEHMTFADWLHRERTRLGLTQKEVAERSGFDDSYINKVEQGHIKFPIYESRQRIHGALGTTEDDLRKAGVIRDATRRGAKRSKPPTGVDKVEPPDEMTGYEFFKGLAAVSQLTTEEEEPRYDDRSWKLGRLLGTMNEEQLDLFFDLLSGIIQLDEIPKTVLSKRRASGE